MNNFFEWIIWDLFEWIIFWMNILDLVLNGILNWIISWPDSMKKWKIKTYRLGLVTAGPLRCTLRCIYSWAKIAKMCKVNSCARLCPNVSPKVVSGKIQCYKETKNAASLLGVVRPAFFVLCNLNFLATHYYGGVNRISYMSHSELRIYSDIR